MFCWFGVPEELLIDQGRNFETEVFQEALSRRLTPLHSTLKVMGWFNCTLPTQLAILTSK